MSKNCHNCKHLRWSWLKMTFYCKKFKIFAKRKGMWRGHYLGPTVEKPDFCKKI